MSDIVFEQLANALDKLPNGFPRTPSMIEIKILKKIFSPEEAALASQLGGSFEPIDEIAKRIGLSVEQIQKQLFKLVRRGMVWLDRGNGRTRLQRTPVLAQHPRLHPGPRRDQAAARKRNDPSRAAPAE